MFAFVVVDGWLVAERYSRSVADYRALNADLSRRVADREQQLQLAFDALREQQTAIGRDRAASAHHARDP